MIRQLDYPNAVIKGLSVIVQNKTFYSLFDVSAVTKATKFRLVTYRITN